MHELGLLHIYEHTSDHTARPFSPLIIEQTKWCYYSGYSDQGSDNKAKRRPGPSRDGEGPWKLAIKVINSITVTSGVIESSATE